MILESEEAKVVFFRSAHIKQCGTVCFCVLHGSPKQPGHCSQVVEPRVGTSVLVINDVSEPQSKYRGHGFLLMISDSNIERVSQTANQAAKPSERNRRQSLSLTSYDKQAIERPQKFEGVAAAFAQIDAVGVANAPLNGISMKAVQNLVDFGSKIDGMQKLVGDWYESRSIPFPTESITHRT